MQLFAGMTESVETKLGFVAERAKRNKSLVFDRIMHHINEESLKASFQQLRKECAVGNDGTSWEEYGNQLEKKYHRTDGADKEDELPSASGKTGLYPEGEWRTKADRDTSDRRQDGAEGDELGDGSDLRAGLPRRLVRIPSW